MADKGLVSTIKAIVAAARAGDLDGAYTGYRRLFSSPSFNDYEASDQRQALRLMIHAKGLADAPTPAMLAAHRAGIEALTRLVSSYREPADYEMLGMCQLMVGDNDGANTSFRNGLAIERERDAQSDLCGALMKRISML